MERRQGEVKMRQKGISLLFNPYEPLLCRRQSRLQLTYARDARIFYNTIRRQTPNSKLETLNSKL